MAEEIARRLAQLPTRRGTALGGGAGAGQGAGAEGRSLEAIDLSGPSRALRLFLGSLSAGDTRAERSFLWAPLGPDVCDCRACLGALDADGPGDWDFCERAHFELVVRVVVERAKRRRLG